MSYKDNQETQTDHGITVTCANGGQLVSTATDVINFQGLPTAAKGCHKFPNTELVDPLLSLGKLTENGCTVVFKRKTFEVTNRNGTVVLVGQKPLGRNVYTVLLPLGNPQNVPQTLQFINTEAVPKNSPENCNDINDSLKNINDIPRRNINDTPNNVNDVRMSFYCSSTVL